MIWQRIEADYCSKQMAIWHPKLLESEIEKNNQNKNIDSFNKHDVLTSLSSKRRANDLKLNSLFDDKHVFDWFLSLFTICLLFNDENIGLL